MSLRYSICYAVCIVGLSVCSAVCAKERSGAEIYENICSNCHENGDFDAPKLKDFSAWKPRLAKGKRVLYQSAFKGLGDNMPARNEYEGHLSNREIYDTVNYMVKKTVQYSSSHELVASNPN
ncbi:cytochrome c5 family protein [Moraxellaceae bacterium AER2_44_116]|nr:c-type cytochrome [Moraxellaceae bacterium]TQC99979.1 cytochrome c5 family protein [Moraxellaceae bacterium AER2_44_116]